MNPHKNRAGQFIRMTLKAIPTPAGFGSLAATAYWVVVLSGVLLWANPAGAAELPFKGRIDGSLAATPSPDPTIFPAGARSPHCGLPNVVRRSAPEQFGPGSQCGLRGLLSRSPGRRHGPGRPFGWSRTRPFLHARRCARRDRRRPGRRRGLGGSLRRRQER